jgi:hypothetical protein
MAQVGSLWLISSKARRVSSYWKECSGATAFEVLLDGLCAGSREVHRADFALAQLVMMLLVAPGGD